MRFTFNQMIKWAIFLVLGLVVAATTLICFKVNWLVLCVYIVSFGWTMYSCLTLNNMFQHNMEINLQEENKN